MSRLSRADRRGHRARARRDRDPRSAAPSFSRCNTFAWRAASVTAATTRSSSVSTSSGSTTLGSIEIAAQRALTVDRRLHDTAADGRLDDVARQRVLRGLHVGLHLLDLLEHVHRVVLVTSAPISRAGALRRPARRVRRRAATRDRAAARRARRSAPRGRSLSSGGGSVAGGSRSGAALTPPHAVEPGAARRRPRSRARAQAEASAGAPRCGSSAALIAAASLRNRALIAVEPLARGAPNTITPSSMPIGCASWIVARSGAFSDSSAAGHTSITSSSSASRPASARRLRSPGGAAAGGSGSAARGLGRARREHRRAACRRARAAGSAPVPCAAGRSGARDWRGDRRGIAAVAVAPPSIWRSNRSTRSSKRLLARARLAAREPHDRDLEHEPRVGDGLTADVDDRLTHHLDAAHQRDVADALRELGEPLRLGGRPVVGNPAAGVRAEERVAQRAQQIVGDAARVVTGRPASRARRRARRRRLRRRPRRARRRAARTGRRRARRAPRASSSWPLPTASAWSRSESASRADPPARAGDEIERVGVGVDALAGEDVGEVADQLVVREQRELEVLRARADRRQHLLRIGGREHEHDVRGRLLERLQQRVRRRRREHVHLVDDVDLAPARGAHSQVHALDEVAHRVDAVVRRGVELHEIEERARPRPPGSSRTCRTARRRRRDRDSSAPGPGCGPSWSCRCRAGPEKRYAWPVRSSRTALRERDRDVILADQLGEVLRPVLAIQRRHAGDATDAGYAAPGPLAPCRVRRDGRP